MPRVNSRVISPNNAREATAGTDVQKYITMGELGQALLCSKYVLSTATGIG